MTEGRIRHRKLILGTLVLILCGVLYYCFVKVTGIGIPCFFRLITGFKCPGCGISTMLMALAEGDLPGAYEANRFLLVTSPFLLFELLFSFRLSWRGEKQPVWNNTLLVLYAAALILFGILRNLPGTGA